MEIISTIVEAHVFRKVKNDIKFYNIHENNFAGIIFIGGKGIIKYWNNSSLHYVVKKFHQSKKIIGAICSAVVILANSGIKISRAACYPENKTVLEKQGIEFVDEPVIICNKIITGRDSQASYAFAEKFLHLL